VEEQLAAVGATEAQTAKLRLWPGAPLQEISRVTPLDTRQHRYRASLD
jgi:hypothetical protein